MLPIRGPSKEEGDIKNRRGRWRLLRGGARIGSAVAPRRRVHLSARQISAFAKWELARPQVLNYLPENLEVPRSKSARSVIPGA